MSKPRINVVWNFQEEYISFKIPNKDLSTWGSRVLDKINPQSDKLGRFSIEETSMLELAKQQGFSLANVPNEMLVLTVENNNNEFLISWNDVQFKARNVINYYLAFTKKDIHPILVKLKKIDQEILEKKSKSSNFWEGF